MSKKFGFDRIAGKMGRRGWKKSKSNRVNNVRLNVKRLNESASPST